MPTDPTLPARPACPRPHTPGRVARVLGLLLALQAGACTYFHGDSRVLVTSTPPGAYIFVDGSDSGLTTPSMVDLGGILGDDHTITLRKRGFGDETREVFHYTTAYTAKWIDGALEPGLWQLPLWWTMGDWFFPAGVRWRYVPHELHVRLYREGEGPVTVREPGDEPESRVAAGTPAVSR